MNLADITPVILTLNEAANIGRCLERLSWAPSVVVLDSFSTDTTIDMARAFDNVRLSQRAFDDHTTQWNHAVGLVTTPWVLSLDADYILPEDFARELSSLEPTADTEAYFASFRYCVLGKELRGSLYPPRAVLFRRDVCTYVDDGHTQLLKVNGTSGQLSSMIRHDDRKSLSHWVQAQARYAALEAQKLLATPAAHLNRADRLRRWVVLAPPLVLFYTLIWRGLIFDGLPGWHYVLQRTLAETMLSLMLIDRKLRQSPAA